MAVQAGGSRGLQLCGCVASDELEAVGAGKVRWLDNPSILVAMAQQHLAVATEQVMVMRLSWKQQQQVSGDSCVFPFSLLLQKIHLY